MAVFYDQAAGLAIKFILLQDFRPSPYVPPMVALQAKSVSAENSCGCRRLGGNHRRSGKSLVEVGGKVDEIRDGHAAVVIHIAIGVSCVALPEVGGERDKVGDGNSAVM